MAESRREATYDELADIAIELQDELERRDQYLPELQQSIDDMREQFLKMVAVRDQVIGALTQKVVAMTASTTKLRKIMRDDNHDITAIVDVELSSEEANDIVGGVR